MKNRRFWTASAVFLSFLVLALVVLNFQKYDVGPFSETSKEVAVANSSDKTSLIDETADGPELKELAALFESETSSWIVLGHKNYKFTIQGAVADEESKTNLEASAKNIFGSLEGSSIEINPNLTKPAWIGDAKSGEGLGGLMRVVAFTLIEAEVGINDDSMEIRGVAPAGGFLDGTFSSASAGFVSADATLPALVSDISEVDLRTPTLSAAFTITESGSILTLTGDMPSQGLVNSIVAKTEILFSESEVVNNVRISDDTFAFYPFIDFHKNLNAFKPFRTFEVAVSDEKFFASITFGIGFGAGSTDLTPQVEQAMSGLISLMNREQWPIALVGFTDNTGDPAKNLQISQDRAEAMKKFLVESGVSCPNRIGVEGRGGEEPVGDNSVAAGRAENRRVEIRIDGGAAIATDC